ncbi:YcnI family protein [Roseomonas xinghualingensis]|uniref:YcnI family protein n=1 Tax=Roseomonas xinghualingensis TaxID=2986475 RepID=UPI0021F15EAE|nr:YcnI family protein [Roseomonas sp. SXEYE001]MCV4207471.1 YcnI family protein [Roseomonas sp. SXEYE001]
MTFRFKAAALGLLALAAASPAGAHVTADRSEMPADSYVRIALRVGHGCQGAATTGIRLTVPSELRSARPMPHPGWTLETGGAEHAGHHAGHHGAPAPREIAWTGGRLEDSHFDEFVLFVRSPAEPGSVITIPVVQECEGGAVARWTERASEPGERVAHPAPLIRVVAGR